jgi:hypothetical protein
MWWYVLNSSGSGCGPVADSCDMVTNVWFHKMQLISSKATKCRSHWPCGLKLGSAPARLLRMRVRIPPGDGCLSLINDVCFRNRLITRSEEFY